jgi:hypothetical protein
MPHIVMPTLAHVHHVAQHMRAADVAEVKAGSGQEPGPALLLAMEGSDACRAIVDDDGVPFGLYGVGPFMMGLGCPWFLGTDGVGRNGKWFARNTAVVVGWMHSYYPILVNWADARNSASILWLTKCAGFHLDALEPYGKERRLFFRFSKVSHV